MLRDANHTIIAGRNDTTKIIVVFLNQNCLSVEVENYLIVDLVDAPGNFVKFCSFSRTIKPKLVKFDGKICC